MPTLNDFFDGNSPFNKALPGFTERPAQRQMAEAIADAIHDEKHLVVEAGTGTGKTLAYLVPVFLTDKKTVLSTGTRTLQDQLYFRDIPLVKSALTSSKHVALLKGRSNYLCHYRLTQLEQGERLLPRTESEYLPILSAWKSKTLTGDIAELKNVPEDSGLWREVTSTLDSCLAQDCPFVKDCLVLKARRTAMAADIVVVNHALFLSDLALQEEGFGELLPDADIVVFDEAHELPELLSQFFSTRFSARQLNDLARDGITEAATNCPELPEIVEQLRTLQTHTRTLRTALGDDNRRALWPKHMPEPLQMAINHIRVTLETLVGQFSVVKDRNKSLEHITERLTSSINTLNQLTGEANNDAIHWFETHMQGFTLQRTPLNVAESLRPFLEIPHKSLIFTSATLTVASRFNAFSDAMGLAKEKQLQLDSPFNYPEQAMLYVPRGLPDPKKPHYTESLIHSILPLLEITQGRTFLLFTSYRALSEAADILSANTDFTLLIQGTLPKKILLDQFITLPRTVLLGTASFWQGVDVRGSALSCVVIDRLPFAPPDDPVLQARMQKMRSEGQNPFQACQLAEAVLSLKQGAGRLIRGFDDRGILVIGDPRLVGARYGHAFLQSLPPMARTRDLNKVSAFLVKALECAGSA